MAMPQHETRLTVHEVKFMPHMFMRVTALINIEMWFLFPMNGPSRWSRLGLCKQRCLLNQVVVVVVVVTTT